MQKRFLFFFLIFLIFPSFALASVERTASTETICNGNICTKILYSGTKFAQNSQGEWVNPSELLSITKNQDDITFHYNGIKGDYSITFEAGVIYNGNYYSMADVKGLYPQIEFDFPTQVYDTHRKYAVNISNIPLALQPNLDYITLTYKEHSGFDLSDLLRDGIRYKVKNIFQLLFDDLIENNFTVSINISERRIKIGNLTDKFNDDSLWLDPILTLGDDSGENLDDSEVNSGSPNTNFGSETSMGLYDDDSQRDYIKFNISGLPSGKIIDSALLDLSYSGSWGSGSYKYIYHVYSNVTWNESDITWNNQPCGTNFDNSTACNLTYTQKLSGSGSVDFDVTPIIKKVYNSSYNNVSFAIKASGNRGYSISIYTKEVSESWQKPELTINYYSTDETESPTWANHTNNATNNVTSYGDTVTWEVTLEDNDYLDYYIFAHNMSGTLTNQTPQDTSGVSITATSNIVINVIKGNYICGQFWFNDTSGNINTTNQTCFLTGNDLPTTTSDIVPASPTENDDINGTITFSDNDGDTAVINQTRWYKDNVEQTELRNLTNIKTGNTTANEKWIFSSRSYDGTNWSIWDNSSEKTILDVTSPIIKDIDVTNKSTIIPLNTMINLTANCTDVSSNISSVIFTYYNTTKSVFNITTTTNSSDIYYYNFTLDKKGNWTFNSTFCIDSSSNVASNTSYSYWVYIDDFSPSITNINFSDTSFDSATIMNITITCTDVGSAISWAKVEINLSGTLVNYTMSNDGTDIYYKAQTYAVGTHTVTKFFCQDSSGNLNTTTNNTVLTVTASTTTVGGGGGGSTQEKLVCNESGMSWDITTGLGRSGYTFNLPYKNKKPIKKEILITNYGLEPIEINLGCEKTDNKEINICNYINFSNNTVNIAPNPQEAKTIFMYIETPENATLKDEFSFNIIANDSVVCSFSINNKAHISRFSFNKWKEVNLSKLNENWENIIYPSLLIASLSWVIVFVIGVLISKKTNPFIGAFGIGGLFGSFVFLLILWL